MIPFFPKRSALRCLLLVSLAVITTIAGSQLSIAQSQAPAPTYAQDIAPLLNSSCIECHYPGGIGPFSLRTYADVKNNANQIAAATADRFMPPWRAQAGWGEFQNERRLSETEIATIQAWAAAGAPAGDLAQLTPSPPIPDSGWRLGEPDQVFTMPQAFDVPADGEDIYRYFVLDGALLEDKTVVAIDFQPGAKAVVHHANFFVDYEGRGRKLTAADPLPGFSTQETGGFMDYDGASAIGGWAPGVDPYQLPSGIGASLRQGGEIVIEIHYHLKGQVQRDRSRLGLYYAKTPVEKYIEGLIIGTQDLEIPAGEANYWRQFGMVVPADMELVDISPHMHSVGKAMQAIATLPNGTQQPLICIPDWALDWQNTFVYRQPVRLPAGSRIDAWFRYDNSAANPANPNQPPVKVQWGWQSTDEMSEIYLGVVPEDWHDGPKILAAAQASWWQWATPGQIPDPCSSVAN
ncbi:MAG: ascorbate-dependent monooxygenase [Cyanobacteria bacterium P01_G01_bin.54]